MAEGNGECTADLKPRIYELACILDQAINDLEQDGAYMSYEQLLPSLSVERPGRYEWAD